MAFFSRDLLLCVVIFLIRCYLSDVVVRPQNATVCENDTVSITCQTTVDDSIDWTFKINETTQQSRIFSRDGVLIKYRSRFRVLATYPTGIFELLITNVTVADAGKYTCVEDSGNGPSKSSTYLQVSKNDSLCGQSRFQSTTIEGSVVSIGNTHCSCTTSIIIAILCAFGALFVLICFVYCHRRKNRNQGLDLRRLSSATATEASPA